MPLILGANSLAGGYQVKNSLRFNSGSSDYLNRTPASSTNRKTFTFSKWVKKSDLSNITTIFSTGINSTTNGFLAFYFDSTGYLKTYIYETNNKQVTTNSIYRDPSAWYHIVLAVDTTQATASDRVKIYVNGSQVTDVSLTNGGYPSQNFDLLVNSTTEQRIGVYKDSGGTLGQYWDGYMSEFYLIDGQALTPSSFGETDTDTGIWKPKAYTGTFGTNGFYLDFEDSANLGNDMSGNNNDFTVNNLTSIDQTTDTPTNNFATMNPLRQPTSNQATFTNGNLTVATSTNDPAYYGGRSTMGMSSGKWYFESKVVSQSSATAMIGIQNTDSYTPELFNSGTGAFAGYSTTGWSYSAYDGGITNNNSGSSYGNSYTTGDIISVALDLDNNKLYFAKNGTWQNSGVPTSGATGTGAISITSGLTYLFAVDDGGGSSYCTWDCNFGNPPYSSNAYQDANGRGNFSYSVPSGFYSLCTANLSLYG